MSIEQDLKFIHRFVTSAINKIQEEEQLAEMPLRDMIEACQVIDNEYKDYCARLDEEYGEEPGTTYEEGISLEFEIEASWWHDVSLALRKIQEKGTDK